MPWWELKAIADSNRMEQAQYNALPPDACPKCGQPLDIGWVTEQGGGKQLQRHCDAGHYTWTGGQREM